MSEPCKKATFVDSFSVYLPLYNKSIAKYFDELKFYDSFEELTLTFRKYKSLPRRVFASCLISCCSANKVIRNFVRTFISWLQMGFCIFVKIIMLTLIFSCSHVRDVRVGLNRISRPQTVRAEITTGRERLPWKSDFNFCILQKSSVSYVMLVGRSYIWETREQPQSVSCCCSNLFKLGLVPCSPTAAGWACKYENAIQKNKSI